MKAGCEEIQIKIVTIGVKAASADRAVKAHLADCPLCADFVHSAEHLESTEMNLEEYDVPEDAFARTISEVKKAQAAAFESSGGPPKRKGILRYLFDPIIAPAMAMALCGIVVVTLTLRSDFHIVARKSVEFSEVSPAASDLKKEKQSMPEGAAKPMQPQLAEQDEAKSVPFQNSAPVLDVMPQKRDAAGAEIRNEVTMDAETEFRQQQAAPKPVLRSYDKRSAEMLRQDDALSSAEMVQAAPAFSKEGADKVTRKDGAPKPTIDMAADAVTQGRFDDARAMVESIFPKSNVIVGRMKSAGNDAMTFETTVTADDRTEILAAINDIKLPGHDTPQARAAIRDRILKSKDAVWAVR